MCACEPTFVCSRCADDPRQDWRMEFELEPESADEQWQRIAEREAVQDAS